MKLDRITLRAALITLALALPVHYLVEAVFVFGGRALLASEGPIEDPTQTVVVAAVGAAPPIEPAEAEPVDALPRAEVSGTLRTADGSPVAEEIVELRSESRLERYAGMSDWRGRFSIPGVAVAGDYRLTIDSEGRYRELTDAVEVPGEGLTLELVLDPLARADLSGRMVDPDGAAIPGRTLLVTASHNDGHSLLVTGDDRGRFRIEDAPTGRLTFTTRTLPHFKVRGPLLTPGAEAEVTLVLDSGEHELSGRIVGDRGAPIPGATLKLSWSYRHGGLVSSSTRTAVSDDEGDFRFSELGRGPHQLAVYAHGYEEARETVLVSWSSSDVELSLRSRDR